MKIVFAAIIACAVVSVSVAQLKPIDTGSSVEFNVKHFGIKTGGSFSGLQGTITFDDRSLSDSKFDVSIDTKSIQTGIDLRDDHLRGEAFFDVAKYPHIHFTSSGILEGEKGSGLVVTGQLTIKDRSKEISIPFTATPTKDGYVLAGSFKINRSDFGVGNPGVISDGVEVILKIVTAK
jgi:polyisoprenoid-binding protein YceI